MIRKVSEYIKQNNLINPGDRIVAGISGGADSVCLLHILYQLSQNNGTKIIAVHVNHGIRGSDADLDEQYVQSLCGRLGVECFCFHYDVKKIARENGLSEEEAGRNVRYDSFLQICRKFGCNKLAIAHNKNDNAETVLFHLFRGSGIKGLTGIDNFRTIGTDNGGITLIRPLLGTSRSEIEEYLNNHGIVYRTDTTNLSNDYSRNKIRNQVLAYVTKEINKNAVDHITEAASLLLEAERFIDHFASERFASLVEADASSRQYRVKDIRREDIVIQKGIIFKIIENLAGSLKDIEAKHVEETLALYDRQVGKQIHLPYGIIAEREYHAIRIYTGSGEQKAGESISGSPDPLKIEIPGSLFLPRYHKYLKTGIIRYEKDKPIPENTCTKWFDYDKIENAVELRTRKEGDYIQINSEGGRKKLKDYFIDQKIPKSERGNRLLVCDGSHVMWILGDGERISEKYKINPNTKKILWMNLVDAEEKENGR